jgi:hypothetical protein
MTLGDAGGVLFPRSWTPPACKRIYPATLKNRGITFLYYPLLAKETKLTLLHLLPSSLIRSRSH